MPTTWADLDWTDLWADGGAVYDETWGDLDWTTLYGVIPPPPPYVPAIHPYSPGTATLSPVATGGTILPLLTAAPAAIAANRPAGRIAAPVLVTPSARVVAATSTTSQLVHITAAQATVGAFVIDLAPAATVPTEGIPVYFGPTAPTAAGPWLWIDSATYDFILETG